MSWAFYELLEHRPLAAWQSGGVSRLLSMGDLLRLDGHKAGLRRAISQSVLYGPSLLPVGVPPRGAKAAAALQSLQEILDRSDICPVAPSVDECIRRELAERFGRDANSRLGPEETLSLVLRWCVSRHPPAAGPPLSRFDDEPDGAGLERRIWEHVQSAAGGQLRAWLHPQGSIGSLLGSTDDRRVDFVLCPPWKTPLVWEAHGIFDPHDQLKSSELRRAKLEVFDQIAGTTSKARVEEVIRDLLPGSEIGAIEPWEQFLIDAGWVASQVDLTLRWLLTTGRWCNATPRVHIRVDAAFVAVVQSAIDSWCELVRALGSIWSLDHDDQLLTAEMSATVDPGEGPCLVVEIDPAAPTYLDASSARPTGTFEVRRACFPVDVDGSAWSESSVAPIGIRPTAAPSEEALLTVMHRLFAKPGFRPGQVKAIQQAVTSNDALILFPTGYGKSLVFQMASFLLPGVTLVIEPFRALLDDQERNLQDQGIGRVACIHSGRPLHGGELRAKLQSACLIYVAAERMHVSEFIALMVEVARTKGLDLFIVDEAHTVSQFGHSFRPAYLDLIERIDAICGRAGRSRPTTLALTATAAQRVIHDIQALLRIIGDPISLDEFASNSFVRANLEDAILDVNIDLKDAPGESRDAADERRKATVREQLSACLSSTPRGQGIVFCPTKKDFKPKSWLKRPPDATAPNLPEWIVGSPLFGAQGIREQIALIKGPNTAIGLYTGSSDDDDSNTLSLMAEHARAFSQGRRDIMVATSAFGTGVDLQGVRWTVHVGMPGGLEAYYQESGRAGRDGSEARSVLLVDWDSDDLLDAMTVDASEEDPVFVLQSRLRVVQRRGSIARQLGLLIGDAPPTTGKFDLQEPVFQYDDQGTLRKNKKGQPLTAFKPSFPGWRWEIKKVDEPLHTAVLGAERGKPIEFWCHTWWEDLVWKAIYRLAVMGVIRHGFEHSLRKSDARTAFILERCDDADTISPEMLIGRVEAEVYRLTSIERARAARETLRQHLGTADASRRLTLSSAMLLKTVYRVVYETRIESLRSLVRYAREPQLQKRRDIIEDYFAPSDLKRQVFALCGRPATVAVLAEALALAESQPRWRSAVYEVAASEYPGSLVPLLLLSVGGIKAGDPGECSRYLFALLSNESVQLEARSWCYAQIATRARHAKLWASVLNGLAGLMKSSPSLATLEALVHQMEDVDGQTELGHLLVAEFFAATKEVR